MDDEAMISSCVAELAAAAAGLPKGWAPKPDEFEKDDVRA